MEFTQRDIELMNQYDSLQKIVNELEDSQFTSLTGRLETHHAFMKLKQLAKSENGGEKKLRESLNNSKQII